jgi:membrane protease YdiL (CAAX protease family)
VRPPDLLIPATPSAAVEAPAALHRRRLVVVVALAAGTALLAGTLRAPRGSTAFTTLGLLVAAVWIAAAWLAGPVPIRPRGALALRPAIVQALALGVVAFGGFLVVDLVARHVPVLAGALDSVLGKADAGSLAVVIGIAVLNAFGEEVFFRGAVHAAFEPPRAGWYATLVYVAVTAATLNPALVLAAAVMGTVFTLERLSTRGVLAPVLTHTSWSLLMLLALPR